MSDQSATHGEETVSEDNWNRIWVPRAALITVTVLAVGFGVQWMFKAASDLLLTTLLSIFIAFALLPAVEILSKRGWRRGPATGVVMFCGGLFGLAFTAALLNVAVGEVIRLLDQLPSYIETTVTWVNDTFGADYSADTIVEQVIADEDRLQSLSENAVSGVLGLAATTLGLLFQALTITLFVFYILADLPRLRESILRRMPPSKQVHVDTVIGITIDKVGGYVYSRSVLAGASAVFHFIIFQALGMPYAVALAMWVGLVSQFIPTVGTYIAGAFPVLIALVEDPSDAILVLIAIILYQQVENYALSPKITANTMNIHPAVAFGSVLLGGALLGGVGALLALPAAASVTALVETYSDHYEVVRSGKIEGQGEYEDRMLKRAAEKGSKTKLLRERLHSFNRHAKDA